MPQSPTAPAPALFPALRRAVLLRDAAGRTDGELLTAFLRDRDGDAFALLVRRHGPMVLGVARRVIGDHHAADDAFQAVFLVLARRANAVRPRERVGNWLYGVAYRTAIKARMVLARRRSREKQVDAMPEPAKLPTDSWSDLQPVLDAELARLPDKLRLPIVLCDLEGRPQRSVAKQLGLAPATLAARVAAARRLLAGRLAKRGISLSGGALAVVLGERAATAAVPPALADSAVRAAEAVAAGAAATGLVSAHALHLCEGVMRMMMLAKLKTAAGAVLIALAAIGVFGFPRTLADEPKPEPAAEPKRVAAKPAPSNDDEQFLRRTLLDLTGSSPTALEVSLFRTDVDASKKSKVIDWLIADARILENVSKRLGISADRLQLLRRGERSITVRVLDEAAPVTIHGLSFNDLSRTRSLGFGIRLVEPQTTMIQPFVIQPDTTERLNLGTLRVPVQVVQDGRSELAMWAIVKDPEAQKRADLAFVQEAVKSARGTDATPLEERYFTEDANPKKRDKLLDELLKDPAVAKKLGADWKKKMLEPKPEMMKWRTELRYAPTEVEGFRYSTGTATLDWVHRVPDKMAKLVDSLIAAKKTDEQILEAVTLAAVSRLPTAEEKKATLAVIGIAADKKAAWIAVGNALGK